MLIHKTEKDPLGQALLAFLAGDKNAHVIATSDLAEDDPMPMSQFFRKWRDLPVWEQIALKACRGNVLDIGAGAGSHALILQAMNMDVTALDVSPGAVEVMKARGVKKAIHADIFEFEGGPFQTLLLMMNGIGLVGDLGGLNVFLEKAKSLLKPEGQIILDSSDLSFLMVDGHGVMQVDNSKAYFGEVSFQMKYGKVRGKKFDWLYLDYGMLEEAAEQAGYTSELMYEDRSHYYLARLRPN